MNYSLLWLMLFLPSVVFGRSVQVAYSVFNRNINADVRVGESKAIGVSTSNIEDEFKGTKYRYKTDLLILSTNNFEEDGFVGLLYGQNSKTVISCLTDCRMTSYKGAVWGAFVKRNWVWESGISTYVDYRVYNYRKWYENGVLSDVYLDPEIDFGIGFIF